MAQSIVRRVASAIERNPDGYTKVVALCNSGVVHGVLDFISPGIARGRVLIPQLSKLRELIGAHYTLVSILICQSWRSGTVRTMDR